MSDDDAFDEEGWRKHVIKTVEASRGGRLEFTFRDVYKPAETHIVRGAPLRLFAKSLTNTGIEISKLLWTGSKGVLLSGSSRKLRNS